MATSTEWTNSGLVDQLRRAAKEIADEGLPGWGNICSDAADLIERLSDGPSDRKDAERYRYVCVHCGYEPDRGAQCCSEWDGTTRKVLK